MMKNVKTVTLLMILFCCLVLLLTVLDFAALHDIRQDYVSKYIRESCQNYLF